MSDSGPRWDHPLRAVVHGPTEVRFTLVDGAVPEGAHEYRLVRADGVEYPIGRVDLDGPGRGRLTPDAPIDPLRVHHLEIPHRGLRALVRRDPIFRSIGSSKPLGSRVESTVEGPTTRFALFSPRATAVRLYLYGDRRDTPEQALEVVDLSPDPDGVWEAEVEGDRTGQWYDFTVHGPDDPGDWFYDAHPAHVSDPYALVNDDALGKSRVWQAGAPPPPVRGGRPAMEDVVAYEVHVQDFTDLLPVGEHETGTFPAMVRPGLRNSDGQPIGLDHLVDLGVNVVHLMPVQEYLHYPDEEWRADLEGDLFAIAMGIDSENYQWGYRTTHAFAVETRYRSRDTDPGAERAQFKALVEAFHERGISVIVDVVPNHTGENMDGRHLLLHFNVLDMPYHYRTDDDLQHIGPFGNEVKTEDRPMVQRWLIDQLRHWMDVLGVDGFRFDLAGQIDRQTLLRVKESLPDDAILYGEPWIPPSDPSVRANPEWSWYKADAPITFFQDEARNAFKGSPFHIDEPGWAGGDPHARDATMRALANDFPEESLSTNGISYLDIHDNWALADRFSKGDDNSGLAGVRMGAMRIAAGLLFTSAGPIVINGGTEMLRTKGLAGHEEFVREIAGGPIYFKGRSDTYNVRVPNRFHWEGLKHGSDPVKMRDWWKGLIALRMSPHGSVFRVAEVPRGHYRFITPHEGTLLGYVVGERVLVLANSGRSPGRFDFELPDGVWTQVTDGERVDLGGVGGPTGTLGGGPHGVEVAPARFLVWVRS